MDIGMYIRQERKKMGWSQSKLAEKSGVGLNFVYQLEKNKPSVQLDSLQKVLGALGLKISLEASCSSPVVFSPRIERKDPWASDSSL